MVDKVQVPPQEEVLFRNKAQEEIPNFTRYPMELESGYGDGDQNSFYAERQAWLWASESASVGGKQGYNQILDDLNNTVDSTQRRVADQELANSAIKVASKERDFALELAKLAENEQDASNIIMQGVQSAQKIITSATTEPKAAASAAVIETLNPALAPVVKDAFAFQDRMRGDVAKRIEDRRFVDLSTSNWFADGVALLAIPARTSWGQSMFGQAYFDTIHRWPTLTTEQQNAEWPTLEQQLWDAAGNNAIVYASLVTPFLDPSDAVWAYIDRGLDVAVLGSYLYSGFRLGGAIQNARKAMRFRNLALRVGNKKAAGEATAGAIAKGDQIAILDGHPIRISTSAVPDVTEGLTTPTTSHMVNELFGRGIIPDPVTDSPMEAIKWLNDTEAAEFEAKLRNQLPEGALVKRVGDTAEFSVTIKAPSIQSVPIGDARAELIDLADELKIARKSLAQLTKVSREVDVTGEIAGVNKQIEGIKARQKVVAAGVENATKLEKGGVTVTTIKLPGDPVDITFPMFATVDDVGRITFTEGQTGMFSEYLLSQEFRADNVVDGLTSVGSFIQQQQRRLYGHLNEQIKRIENTLKSGRIRGLFGKDEKRRVGAVLLKGDQEQVVFSPHQLSMGIETPELGMVYLSEKEIEAYTDMREVFDDLWRITNAAQREDLRTAGFSAMRVQHVGKDGVVRPVTIFAKANHDDIRHAIPTVGKNPITHAIDARTGQVVDLTTVTNLQEDLNAGRRGFIELKGNFIQGDGSHYKWAIAEIDHIGDLKKARDVFPVPEKVLDYRRGYVPKLVADRVGFVVETEGELIRNGVKIRDVIKTRGFKTRAEAEIYRDRKLAEGATEEDYFIKALDDSAYAKSNPEANDFVTQQLFKGAFGGDRTDGVFKIGLDGQEAGRMSAFESIRRYADYVGRHAPMHTFKQGMIKRFLNSVKDARGRTMLETPYDWTSKLTMSSSDPNYRSALAIQDWMKSVFSIPTNQERWFGKFTEALGYQLDRLIWNKAAGTKRFGAGISSWAQEKLLTSPWAKNPIQAVKANTFDMMLGMFNPIQYVVQSAGMAVPLSLHPVEGMAALPDFLAMRTLWKLNSADDAARMATMMGLDGEEFAHLWSSFRRSGVPDSILENADFGHYATTAHGYYSPQFFAHIKEKGRIFYNMGELNNRTFSWVMAYRRMLNEGKISNVKALTSEEILAVNKEALRLGMNMMQSNRAVWQTGVASLPTQFMQSSARFYENMLAGIFKANKGGKWTATEAWTALGMSTLMWGAANWGVDEMWAGFEDWLVDPNGPFALDPEKDAATIAAARGGLTEFLAFEALGWTPDISDRISLGSGVSMMFENLIRPLGEAFFAGDLGEMASAAVGASGNIGTRFGKAAKAYFELFRGDVLTGEIDENTIMKAATNLASLTSTGSNIMKAHMWNSINEIINDRTGQPFGMSPPSENPGMIYLQGVGISPLDIEKYYIIDKKSRAYKEHIKEVTDTVAGAFRKLYVDGGVRSEFQRREFQRTISVALSGLNATERNQVWEGMRKIWKEDTKINNLEQEMFKQMMTDPDNTGGVDQNADLAILRGMEP